MKVANHTRGHSELKTPSKRHPSVKLVDSSTKGRNITTLNSRSKVKMALSKHKDERKDHSKKVTKRNKSSRLGSQREEQIVNIIESLPVKLEKIEEKLRKCGAIMHREN